MVAMTDFYSVLQRAVQSLPDGSGPQRRQVYEKARKALIKQLQSFDPPLSSADVTAQRLALEDAIRKIENEIARQNRTRRAVQGALPAGGRTGDAAARESEAEREARRRAEAERTRAERAEMLRSAVSDAMLSPDPDSAPAPTPQAGPQPAQLPAPMELSPEPIETAEAEVVGDDFLEQEYEEPVPIVPARRRGQRADPAMAADHIDEAEYEAVEEVEEIDAYADEDDEDEVDPKEEKRRRREEERQLRAERRAERSSRGKRKAKAAKEKKSRKARPAPVTGEEGTTPPRRSIVARIVLPLVVFGLLIGASYAVVTQHERLLAVIQQLSPDNGSGGNRPPERAPVQAASEPVTSKSQARLNGIGEDEPRAVETETFTIGGDSEADGAEGGSADEPAPASEARTPDGAPQFAADPQPSAAEAQVNDVDSPEEVDVSALAAAGEETPATSAETSSDTASPADPGKQQAVLYEEAATGGSTGSAVAGTVNWEMVRQSFGGGDEEAVIRAAAVIGERGLSMTVTIRENKDAQLPASHLIEIKFDVPDSFEGGGVKNVPGIIMKAQESARGDALRGQAARVSSGLFWVALNEDDSDRTYNLDLLESRDWIDIPILYESGRRAILTLRKGAEGVDAVESAMQQWSAD
ncbi:hypothetical protein [Acuticoccus sp. I52.16.1]|uniref:hypothetical protein n=1 Tax=Acuticoccus sp. I52.16.1 TaxID=2928472 RepID=UPI001FD03FAF|nr:hypothetical protein [Acuticoccus sp. I52.16.1]UOM32937.1 hypothetical protein MRB58_13745 [Acuticoccus sp. I52.16.1]